MQRDFKFTKSSEKINNLICVDDIKMFLVNEKELETLIQTISIYSQNIRMKFSREKCAMLIIKSGENRKRKK